MLADLFLCPPEDLKALNRRRSPLKSQGGQYDGIDLKNVHSLHIALLWASLEGAKWTPETHPFEMIHSSKRNPEDTAIIEHFPARMVGVYAHAQDADIARVGGQLADSPDFRGWEAANLVQLMNEVRALAGDAAGREMCLWSAI